MNESTITLEQINAASLDEACAMLDGLYEHSPWIARAALKQRAEAGDRSGSLSDAELTRAGSANPTHR